MNEVEELQQKKIIAEMRAQIDGLEARLRAIPPPQIVQMPAPQHQNTSQMVQDVTGLVTLMNTITAAIPKPPSLTERMAELREMMAMAQEFNPAGGFSEDGEENPLKDVVALLKAMPQNPSPPANPPTPQNVHVPLQIAPDNSVSIVGSTPPAPIEAEKQEQEDEDMPLTFEEYSDMMIAGLKPREIDAIKSAPKSLLRSMLEKEIKKNHPDMVITDADFDAAYKKVLAL